MVGTFLTGRYPEPNKKDVHNHFIEERLVNVHVGFVGLGEAGYNMAKGLAGEGLKDIKAFDVAVNLGGKYKETVLERAKDAGVTLVDSIEDIVAQCNVIFCAVQAQYSAEVAAKVLPAMRPDVFYIDVTTATPKLKKSMAVEFADKGFFFVDGAMMGALPIDRHKVSMLCSGKGAEDVSKVMNGHGMKMEYAHGDAGMASTLKLARSSFTKGCEALAVEAMLFAHKLGVEKEVLKSLGASYGKTTFDETLVRYIRSDMIHAERRSHEVEECMNLMEEFGVTPIMAKAAYERMQRVAKLGLKEELGGKTPATAEEVFALWDKKKFS